LFFIFFQLLLIVLIAEKWWYCWNCCCQKLNQLFRWYWQYAYNYRWHTLIIYF